MAITNAQQYQQLVNPPMKGKKRPGYRGDDAARSSEGTSKGRASPGPGAGFGDGPSRGISKGNTAREQGIMNQYQGPGGTTLGFNRGPTEIIGGKEFPVNPPTKFEEEQKNFAISIENDRRRREARKRALKERAFLEKLGKFKTSIIFLILMFFFNGLGFKSQTIPTISLFLKDTNTKWPIFSFLSD